MRSQKYFMLWTNSALLSSDLATLYSFKKSSLLRYNLYTIKYTPFKCQFDEFGTNITAYVTTTSVKQGACLIQNLHHIPRCADSTNSQSSDSGTVAT